LSVGNHNETTIRTAKNAKNAKGKKKQKENMAFIQVNGARLYYEVFGDDRPGRAPIVLIHGATSTGHRDWHLVAPLLAQEYRVIVPDCRGHGRSANPDCSYNFRELAADVASLVRALGYERAHVVGHSNGGNVALVTLLEHPEVVQTAILQAANAYVSAGLGEEEPAGLDPDRVAREKPGWVREVVALHGPTHGPDYWRDLWRMTVRETATAPNYTPDDLARVQRPTFVIQGEHDRTNAAAYHAQFIAHHVPDAESWIPTGIGHNVHVETPGVWVERVLGFLARRGDDANDALYRLQRAVRRRPGDDFRGNGEPAGERSGRRLRPGVDGRATSSGARDTVRSISHVRRPAGPSAPADAVGTGQPRRDRPARRAPDADRAARPGDVG
jgi:pimeloyl-ACP methyl ester carboxylesterase